MTTPTYPTDRWAYFEPNWNWSFHLLESDKLLAKIARATVIPFLMVSALESFVLCSQFAANLPIFAANKIYSILSPKIEQGLYFLVYDRFRNRNNL